MTGARKPQPYDRLEGVDIAVLDAWLAAEAENDPGPVTDPAALAYISSVMREAEQARRDAIVN